MRGCGLDTNTHKKNHRTKEEKNAICPFIPETLTRCILAGRDWWRNLVSCHTKSEALHYAHICPRLHWSPRPLSKVLERLCWPQLCPPLSLCLKALMSSHWWGAGIRSCSAFRQHSSAFYLSSMPNQCVFIICLIRNNQSLVTQYFNTLPQPNSK